MDPASATGGAGGADRAGPVPPLLLPSPPAPVRRPNGGAAAARPDVLRTMNERLVLEVVRSRGPVSRSELSHTTGLSKPTVAVAVSALERCALVQVAGVRTGMRGPAAALYEVRPDAAFVLGLDVGREHQRGAVVDLSGSVRARADQRVRIQSGGSRSLELMALAEELAAGAGIRRTSISQVVVGTPGVYDPARRAIAAAQGLPGWEHPDVAQELRELFGPSTVLENDIALAALAERDIGHGRGIGTFCFVSIGIGIGMGLVIDGRLYRGVHGAAGEIAYLPVGTARTGADEDARRHARLERAAAASAVVRGARRRGLGGPVSAVRVFAAAAAGDERAASAVAEEVDLVAQAVASVVAVVDPELIVLGGAIGRAPGFAAAVAEALEPMVPFRPQIRVSALAESAVVDGCVGMGTEIVWRKLLDRD